MSGYCIVEDKKVTGYNYCVSQLRINNICQTPIKQWYKGTPQITHY